MLPGEAKLDCVTDTGKLKEPELMSKEERSRRIVKRPLMKYNNERNNLTVILVDIQSRKEINLKPLNFVCAS